MDNIISIEQAVLSFILSSNDFYDDVLSKLSEEHFSSVICAEIYKLIVSIHAKKITPNLITLKNENNIQNKITHKDFVEVVKWQNSLSYQTPIYSYLEILDDNKLRRQLSTKITESAYKINDNIKAADLTNDLINELNNILDIKEDKQSITMADLVSYERESFYNRKSLAESGETNGLNTGINSLNKFTGGFQSEFIILGGRPSMGKTAVALFHACNFKSPGIYFNLEMNKSQLCQRLILQNNTGNINGANLRDGTLSSEEINEFEKTIGLIEKMPIKIYDKSRCGIHEAVRIIKKEVRINKIKWVIIDYLQLMTIEGHRGNNRELEIAEISRSLKAVQKELNITIIALAQLSRQVEQRQNKKPILSDLRESGSIEQDADTVIFIYRPEYYGLINENTNEPYTNEIFYLFEKHRQGATGEVLFRHNHDINKFFDNDYKPNSSADSSRVFSHRSNEFEPF